MRRSTAYVALSTALAASVTSYAFIERPNFYSAAVYLSQSSACLIILSNAALVYFAGLMYGLQRLLFGTLRPIEIEQLWERGWIAGTEWLFALSIFRDDFGVAYMASFILLFVSKVWGWMVDGRLDILEQQNPANATKFHLRLLVATAINIILPLKMVTYCFEEAVYGPKSGIMTMFTFEFGILLIGAISTTIRYGLWFYEYRLVQKQLRARTDEIRREATESGDPVPPIDDLDVHDLDLPGWEAKSSFQFALDIGTDFLKFAAYLTFFGVLTVLYGLPIYIVRDLYMTGRSFYNRVNDYRQYRNATHNMHHQYPDATAETLAPDNTCIVCREDMKPWIGTLPVAEQAENRATGNFAVHERQRPKQLPCGHILHFSCLRSWLERQQACPICRRSVLRPLHAQTTPVQPRNDDQNRDNGVLEQRNPERQHGNEIGQVRRPRPQGWGFRLGPFRFFFGRLDGEQALERVRQMAAGGRQRQGAPAPAAPGQRHGVVPAAFVPQPNHAPTAATINETPVHADQNNSASSRVFNEAEDFTRSLQAHSLHAHLAALEDMIQQDIRSLNLAGQRVQTIQWLLSELERSRAEVRSLHAAMRLVPSAPGSSTTLPDAASSIPMSQAILDQQGNILTSLPSGWNVIPLNHLPAVPQHEQTSTSSVSHSTGIEATRSANNNGQTAQPHVTITNAPPSNNDSNDDRAGFPSSASISSSIPSSGNVVNESIKPAQAQSATRTSSSQSASQPQTSAAHDITNGTIGHSGTSTPLAASHDVQSRASNGTYSPKTPNDASQRPQNNSLPIRANSSNGHPDSNASSWSFDNLSVHDAASQELAVQDSSSTAPVVSSSAATHGRMLQPTIEDLQDEDLD